jgi:hypothetical protein
MLWLSIGLRIIDNIYILIFIRKNDKLRDRLIIKLQK